MQAGFQATERMEYLAYSDVISKSAQGLVGIAVVLVGFGTIGVTACWAVMTAIVVLLDAYWLHRFVRINLRTTWARSVKVVRESLAYWAFGLFFMIYLWIDFVMLSLMTRSEVVGWYAVPTRLFQTLTFLPVVVATASLPHFVRGFEEGGDRLRRAAKSPLELVLVVSLPIAAAVAITAAPVIHLLYGSAYDHAVPVMVILGLCLPPMYLNIVLAQVLIAMNRQVVWTCVMAATTVINPLFNLALIPWTQHRYGNGAIGAATSLLLTELVCIVVAFVMVARTVFDASTVKRALLAIVAATAMWAAGYETRSFGVVVSLAAAAVAFVVLAVVLRLFTSEDVAAMKSGFTRVAQRVPGLKRRVAPPTAAAAGVPPPA
jgi:O-antigen/teichoic acid export membrane protein